MIRLTKLFNITKLKKLDFAIGLNKGIKVAFCLDINISFKKQEQRGLFLFFRLLNFFMRINLRGPKIPYLRDKTAEYCGNFHFGSACFHKLENHEGFQTFREFNHEASHRVFSSDKQKKNIVTNKEIDSFSVILICQFNQIIMNFYRKEFDFDLIDELSLLLHNLRSNLIAIASIKSKKSKLLPLSAYLLKKTV